MQQGIILLEQLIVLRAMDVLQLLNAFVRSSLSLHFAGRQ